MGPDVVLVTCFGRLSYLRITLPLMMSNTPVPIVVVSGVGCPDGTNRELASLQPRVRVEEVVFPTTPEGQTRFNKPMAVNHGVRYCIRSGHRSMLLLDADTIIQCSAWAELALQPHEFRIVRVNPSNRDLTGVLACGLDEFLDAGGMDESMVGWGAEDTDMRLRLYNDGLGFTQIDPKHFAALAHDDTTRSANYGSIPIQESLTRNMERLVATYYKRTGCRLENDWCRPDIRALLGIDSELEALGLKSKR